MQIFIVLTKKQFKIDKKRPDSISTTGSVGEED